MRKKHWLKITLITLAACALAGVVLAVILFNANPERTSVNSSVEFSFEGAAQGKAPNGYRYDLSGLQSDEVLTAALEEAGMAEKYTADELRANMIVSGVYPEDIVEKMTNYESLLTGDAGKIAVGDYYATLYNVTLYNDFDSSIPREDLEKILRAVMAEYQEYFIRTYSVFLAKDAMLENLSDYDYPQQLDILDVSISRNEKYAEEMAEKHTDFLLNGEGFADVAVRFENLRSVDLERLSGLVTMNALSRNQDRIIAQYENQIRVLQIQLQELQKESENVEALINQYSKDDIIYVSTNGALQKVASNSTNTYDTLVARRQEIADSIASRNKELTEVQLKLNDIRGESKETVETEEGVAEETAEPLSEEEREAQKAVVEKGISAVVTKLNKATEDFAAFLKAYSERELNERTVAITSVDYKAPKYLSTSFAVQMIKTAGPLCALGLIVCIVIMIISQRRMRKREDVE